MEQIILGIDPGTATTGFGIIKSCGQKCLFVDCGQIKTHKDLPHHQRLNIISQSLEKIIKQYKPDLIGIEKLFFARNTTTAMKVAEARGVILNILAQHHLPIVEFTPLQVKQMLTGYGRADKKQILKMTKAILKLKDIPGPDDISDALAIAVCSSFHIKPEEARY